VTDGDLASNKANKNDRSGSRHIIGEKKDNKGKKACEAKAKNESKKIKK
jgi:hypothetical protein